MLLHEWHTVSQTHWTHNEEPGFDWRPGKSVPLLSSTSQMSRFVTFRRFTENSTNRLLAVKNNLTSVRNCHNLGWNAFHLRMCFPRLFWSVCHVMLTATLRKGECLACQFLLLPPGKNNPDTMHSLQSADAAQNIAILKALQPCCLPAAASASSMLWARQCLTEWPGRGEKCVIFMWLRQTIQQTVTNTNWNELQFYHLRLY